MKLLIVDDSNIMRTAIEKYLVELDLELVGSVGDGEKALKVFNEKRPDLVTLDITMPKMNGLICLEKMLDIDPDVKVLVITALKDPSTGLKALKRGAKGFLTKPFSPDELIEEMKILCKD